MANFMAYDPQRSFAYPPRPDDPKVAWEPEWIACVRFRSSAMTLLGMDAMSSIGSIGDAEAGDAPPMTRPSKPKCKGGLAGVAQRAAGLCQ